MDSFIKVVMLLGIFSYGVKLGIWIENKSSRNLEKWIRKELYWNTAMSKEEIDAEMAKLKGAHGKD